MPILNLSKEQYNTFLNSNSLDDFISLRNSVEIVEGLINIPKDHVAIRTLSLSEYNKYIKNGTLDGSIIKNDINVWNTKTYNSQAYCTLAQDTYGGESSVQSTITNSVCEGLPTTHIIVDKNKLPQNKIFYDSCIFELYQNNETNKVFTNFTHKYIICAYTHSGYSYSASRMNMKYITIPSVTKNCYNDSVINNITRTLNSKNFTTTLNLSLIGGFRPAFKFVDNNKSTNIHY